MTAVIDAVKRGDADAALRTLAAMESKDRRKLVPEVTVLYKGWRVGGFAPLPDKPGTSRWQFSDGTDAQRDAAHACLCVLATASELAKNSDLPTLGKPDFVVNAAKRVRPPWLDAEGLDALAQTGKINWRTVDALVAAGLCERPRSDALVESLVEGLGFRSDRPLAQLIRDSPNLIADGMLYRLFEVEGGQQSSLAAADKYRRDANQWATALAELSTTGELDRVRLLDGCLDALARDFATFRAGWFSRFHDRLKPTDLERSARADKYIRLLGSHVPATVSFAAKATEKLVKLGSAPADALIPALSPVLQARQKGTVKRALKLLEKAVRERPSASATAVSSAIEALIHPDPDVQKAILDTIDRLLPQTGDEGRTLKLRLAESADLLVPSLRARVGPVEEAAPVDEALPAPVVTDPLDPSLRLEVADGVDAAIDVVAHALEHEDDPIAQELGLDAIARHASPSGDWRERSGPLRKRALTLWRRGPEHMVQRTLAYLVLTWTKREKPVWERAYAEGKADYDIYLRRIDRLADRLLSGEPSLPLLSTPTHRSGFIESAVFLSRLEQWRSSDLDVDPHDAVIALMRIPKADAVRCGNALDPSVGYFDDAATRSLPSASVRIDSRTSGGYTFHSVKVEADDPSPWSGNCLELWHALVHGDVYSNGPLVLWAATAVPDDLAVHFAEGVRTLGEYQMDDPLASGVHLQPARHPWVELGEYGHWLLCLCLAARGARAIEVGLDVAIDGIDQGRVDSSVAGRILTRLMASDLLKAKRLAKTLSQVAEPSARHADVVIAWITGGLQGSPADAPRDVGALLSLLYELLVSRKARLEDPGARRWLDTQERGGQVAKLRRRILAL